MRGISTRKKKNTGKNGSKEIYHKSKKLQTKNREKEFFKKNSHSHPIAMAEFVWFSKNMYSVLFVRLEGVFSVALV